MDKFGAQLQVSQGYLSKRGWTSCPKIAMSLSMLCVKGGSFPALQLQAKTASTSSARQAELCSYLELLGDRHHRILVLVHDSQEDLP